MAAEGLVLPHLGVLTIFEIVTPSNEKHTFSTNCALIFKTAQNATPSKPTF